MMGQTMSEVIYGYSKPRIESPSLNLPSAGPVVAALADELGVPLLPWQKHVLDDALQILPDGSWPSLWIG